jgi:hypothetical protein
MTCGVAKFNAELAKRLGVRVVPLMDATLDERGAFPLLSIKYSEIQPSLQAVNIACGFPIHSPSYGVFWHDAGTELITTKARNVFFADPSLGSPGLFCPSLITPRPRAVRLFSFGMAHKLQTDKYKRVRELIDASLMTYQLRVSVGLHEGTSLDGAERHFDALRAIMGADNVTILGILSDEAVSEELSNAEYVLAFFEKGLRANNTTVHAAHLAGCSIITNHDADTPKNLRDATINIDTMVWPPPSSPYTWDNLIEAMRKECDKSRLPTAS